MQRPCVSCRGGTQTCEHSVTPLPEGPEIGQDNDLPLVPHVFQGGKCMRRLFTYTTALLLALTGTVAVAQKATNPAALESAMKRISAANGATVKAIKSGAFEDAK